VLARTLGRRPLVEDEHARLEEQIDAAQIGGAVGRALELVAPRDSPFHRHLGRHDDDGEPPLTNGHEAPSAGSGNA
jgi:hypothetical protein